MQDELSDELDEVEAASRILPAWFVTRMMTDQWSFGLLTTTGIVLAITHIDSVQRDATGQIWLDACFADEGCMWAQMLRRKGFTVLTAPVDRPTVSINAAHVVAAFEMADT